MMKKLNDGLKRFMREEEGTEIVEWALVAGLIIAVGAGVLFAIGEEVGAVFENLLALFTPAG